MSVSQQDHPQVQWFARRTHKTQYVTILMAMIYNSERKESTDNIKAKGVWEEIPRRLARCKLPGSSPSGVRSHTRYTVPPGRN